jgi:hypothetical protein
MLYRKVSYPVRNRNPISILSSPELGRCTGCDISKYMMANCLSFYCTVTLTILGFCFSQVKGKVVPLQAWSGPEGFRKLRFPDFLTTAQYGGKVVSLTHRPPLPPGNTPGSHLMGLLYLNNYTNPTYRHFLIMIHKATCFGCTRQPSSASRFRNMYTQTHIK